MTLEAQDSRYGKPAMERVIVRHVPEPGAQRLLIEKGDADIARNLTADQVAGLEGNQDIVIQTDPKALSIYLQVNMRDPVLSKPEVREALRYLVDYQGMADSFLRGQFIVHQSFWPSGFFASLTENPFALDVAKAKALLAEAGHPTASRSSSTPSTPRPTSTWRRRSRRPWPRPGSTSRSCRPRPRRSTPSTGRATSR